MKIFVLREENEARIAITEDIASKLTFEGHTVEFGDKLRTDNDFEIVVSINPLPIRIIKYMKAKSISISLQKPHICKENLNLFKEKNITSFALDMIPRTTRAQYMDVISSQSSLAGYRSVIEAAHVMNRSIPMMITTAGTIPAAKFLVIGAGVAGLQAIATAKRLGAIVSAFDVRKSSKEQVESLGAKFIEIENDEVIDSVYAKETSQKYNNMQEEKLFSVLPQQDVVITSAQIPFKKAPTIIKKEMVSIMKKDSFIIDLASETGGNCELTEHGNTVTIGDNNVKIISFQNILSGVAHDASRLFAKNIYAFLTLLFEKQREIADFSLIDNRCDNDEIIKGTLLTCNGKILKEF
ncbi:MAG: NAD(P)(+) transhydrogenase (Re/Si-specific) subunit alpha [Holosporales bacterium]|jgi:NAD(P) transhydrogenase subunit alpha|nr:NAD(P)(+) transhydrogenase (Re/Si-specific) subunit alpha [Holosporales bacterium]